MKRIAFLFFACTTLFSQMTYSQDCYSAPSCKECFGFDAVLTFDVGGGYRQDKLKWETTSLTNPNFSRKEEWKKLQIGIVETNVELLFAEHYLAKVDFDYGWFDRGGKQHVNFFDRGYGPIGPQYVSETSGHVYNIDGAIGYQFNFFRYRFGLTPLVGYSYHFQKFKNHYACDQFASDMYANSTCKLRWRGPTVGICTFFQICCDWEVGITYTYHFVRYRGKIVDGFNSGMLGQQKSNNIHGNEIKIGTSYQFCPNWMFCINLDYKVFEGNHGNYTPYLENEDHNAKLRHLKWESMNATVDVAYVF